MARVVEPALNDLRETLLRMGSRAEAILSKSLRALWERDVALAQEVPEDDIEIDRLDVSVDDAVLKTLALQHPVAEDLRQVVAVKMIATDLERVGDLARNIARSAQRLASEPGGSPPWVLKKLADATQRILNQALDCFADSDAAAARAVIDADDEIDSTEDGVVRDAIQSIQSHPEMASHAVDVILIAEHLERVGDHATNIAEQVVLIADAENLKHATKLGR